MSRLVTTECPRMMPDGERCGADVDMDVDMWDNHAVERFGDPRCCDVPWIGDCAAGHVLTEAEADAVAERAWRIVYGD